MCSVNCFVFILLMHGRVTCFNQVVLNEQKLQLQERSQLTPRRSDLHQVSQAPLAEDVFEEDHVLFVIGVGPQLRGQQGQRLVKPCRGGRETPLV